MSDLGPSWPSCYALYLQPYEIERHHTLDFCSADTVSDLILFVGHCIPMPGAVSVLVRDTVKSLK